MHPDYRSKPRDRIGVLPGSIRALGHTVTALCRQIQHAELNALPVTVRDGFDVTDNAVIAESAAKTLGPDSIDLLINNAGILRNESLDEMDFDSDASAVRG